MEVQIEKVTVRKVKYLEFEIQYCRVYTYLAPKRCNSRSHIRAGAGQWARTHPRIHPESRAMIPWFTRESVYTWCEDKEPHHRLAPACLSGQLH